MQDTDMYIVPVWLGELNVIFQGGGICSVAGYVNRVLCYIDYVDLTF